MARRYFGFDAGDMIYDGPKAAKHLGKEFLASAVEVRRTRLGPGMETKGSACERGVAWCFRHAPAAFRVSPEP